MGFCHFSSSHSSTIPPKKSTKVPSLPAKAVRVESGGVVRSYGIHWKTGNEGNGKKGRIMSEGQTYRVTEGRTDGTYHAGVKDLASAYVLCPHLSERVCVFLFAEGRNHGKGLRIGFEDDG